MVLDASSLCGDLEGRRAPFQLSLNMHTSLENHKDAATAILQSEWQLKKNFLTPRYSIKKKKSVPRFSGMRAGQVEHHTTSSISLRLFQAEHFQDARQAASTLCYRKDMSSESENISKNFGFTRMNTHTEQLIYKMIPT